VSNFRIFPISTMVKLCPVYFIYKLTDLDVFWDQKFTCSWRDHDGIKIIKCRKVYNKTANKNVQNYSSVLRTTCESDTSKTTKMKKRSEGHKHCALAVVRRSQKISPPPQTPFRMA